MGLLRTTGTRAMSQTTPTGKRVFGLPGSALGHLHGLTPGQAARRDRSERARGLADRVVGPVPGVIPGTVRRDGDMRADTSDGSVTEHVDEQVVHRQGHGIGASSGQDRPQRSEEEDGAVDEDRDQ